MRTELNAAVEAITEALRRREALSATEVYDVLGEVDELVARLPSLVRWLANEAGRVSTDPGLRIDNLGTSAVPSRLADDASRALFHAAYVISEAEASIRPAHSAMSRLYHDQPAEQPTDVHARRAA